MYAWRGDTGDFRGGKPYDFGSARAKYDDVAKAIGTRDYRKGRVPDMKLFDPRGKTIRSESENPIVIAVDVTGSMQDWPGEIFDRLPLIYKSVAKWAEKGKGREDYDFCFAAIGDATCDNYPLQVSDFSKDPAELEKILKGVGCEGGGGGHITESYELFGYFMQHHCELPNAKSPFLLIYGDEAFYDHISPNQVDHFIGDNLERSLRGGIPSQQMWDSLMTKFNVYHLHKPYGGGTSDKEILSRWHTALGKERVIELPDHVKDDNGNYIPGKERAVDPALGLIARTWGVYKDFVASLDARHDDASVKAAVHHSLRHVDASPAVTSVMSKPGKSKMTKSLLD